MATAQSTKTSKVNSVSIRGLAQSYGSLQVLKQLDLDVPDGEFLVLLGPSGCGKSTLLNCIAGLLEPTHGQVFIKGKNVTWDEPSQRGIGMVFQSYALYPHKNVYDNMAFGLKFARTPKVEIEQRVSEAARILQLEPLLKRRPRELSGGQRQRVAIGRAIVRKPQVFLFDEPLSNLDAALRINTRIEIAKLHKLLRATIVYVTHDQVEAMTLADKIVVLEAGEVRQYGAPLELYHHPHNKFVAGFIGSPKMNFLKVEVRATGKASITVEGPAVARLELPIDPADCKKGEALTLGIRPEHISAETSAKRGIAARVNLVELLGHQTYVECEVAGKESMSALFNGNMLVSFGDKLHLSFKPADCHLFRSDDQALKRKRPPSIQAKLKH